MNGVNNFILHTVIIYNAPYILVPDAHRTWNRTKRATGINILLFSNYADCRLYSKL